MFCNGVDFSPVSCPESCRMKKIMLEIRSLCSGRSLVSFPVQSQVQYSHCSGTGIAAFQAVAFTVLDRAWLEEDAGPCLISAACPHWLAGNGNETK